VLRSAFWFRLASISSVMTLLQAFTPQTTQPLANNYKLNTFLVYINVKKQNVLWLNTWLWSPVDFLTTELNITTEATTSQHFMEPKGSLPYSQELSAFPYPEQHQSSLYHPILSLQDSFQKLSTHLNLGLPSDFFPSGFPTNNLYAFLFSPLVLHALLVSSSTWPF
jgi:hypothetical protein